MVSFNSEHEASFRVVEIPSTLRAAREPEDAILREAESLGYAEETLFAVKLALEEAMTNAVKHGNGCDPNKRVTVRYLVTDEKIEVIVCDEGGGFEPSGVPDPTTPDRLPLPNGRGIMLMRAYMDHVAYRRNGTEVYMMKRKGASA
ncbi:MAG: ATP-binding protein [Phycisphaerae bacterium]|nr:ATP-binding protein [Phycisphaerae bacterium]